MTATTEERGTVQDQGGVGRVAEGPDEGDSDHRHDDDDRGPDDQHAQRRAAAVLAPHVNRPCDPGADQEEADDEPGDQPGVAQSPPAPAP